jgi:hypothetical protein
MFSEFYEDPNILASRGVPDFTGVQFHTSAQSLPIPIMWGTRRLSPQIIWQSTVVSHPKGSGNTAVLSTSTTGFGVPPAFQTFATFYGVVTIPGFSAAVTDAEWFSPTILALCEGPITLGASPNFLGRVWRGGGQPAVAYSAAINLDFTDGTQFYVDIFTGTSTQTAWNYITYSNTVTIANPVALFPNQDLAYRFTAYLASWLLKCGQNNVIPQWSFEVTRNIDSFFGAPDSYLLGIDVSPAFFIPDLLFSLQYGMGLVGGDVDSVSLTTSPQSYTNYCFALGLYFSPLLTSQTSGVDLIDRWALLSNTYIFWSGTAIMFAPLGDETITGNGLTFTPDPTPAYNLGLGDFKAPGLVVNRADPIDCFNRVRLEFCDRASDYAKNPIEWKDTTLINQFGLRDASNIDGQDICDVAVAAKVVELVGKRMAYMRNTYSFTVSYRFIRVLPGTILTLTDPNLGLDHVPVRVRTIEEDEKGELAILAEEYPGTLGMSRPQPAQVWSQTSSAGGSGTSTGGTSTPFGNPTPTSGGVLVLTPTMTLVLFVAGDVLTLPNPMNVGTPYVFMHDQRRSPQPTHPSTTDNPVTFQIPVGATYNIEDPTDGTIAPTSPVKFRGPDGAMLTLVNTGDGIIRFRSG